MKVLIIEDEFHAVQYLSGLLKELIPGLQILGTLDTVEESVEWFQNHTTPDLVFMDIQLADGLSFDIFKHIELTSSLLLLTNIPCGPSSSTVSTTCSNRWRKRN